MNRKGGQDSSLPRTQSRGDWRPLFPEKIQRECLPFFPEKVGRIVLDSFQEYRLFSHVYRTHYGGIILTSFHSKSGEDCPPFLPLSKLGGVKLLAASNSVWDSSLLSEETLGTCPRNNGGLALATYRVPSMNKWAGLFRLFLPGSF